MSNITLPREDIIRWAREAEDYVDTIYAKGEYHPGWLEVFNVRFAALVAEAEREACAKVCEEKTAYQMQIPCPDGIPGCLVFHAIEAKREKTGSECAAAIRARGSK
jgi:hypothetical protein